MRIDVLMKLHSDPKMSNYLKQNSNWYKYLNRNPLNYNNFTKTMKEKYKLKVTDKVNKAIENIDTVSSILKVLN